MENKTKGVGTQSHYTSHVIEPIDYIVKNKLNFLEGNIIKYVTRYRLKNGLEDLEKAQQYLAWLIEEESKSLEEVVSSGGLLNEEQAAHVNELYACRDGESIQDCIARRHVEKKLNN